MRLGRPTTPRRSLLIDFARSWPRATRPSSVARKNGLTSCYGCSWVFFQDKKSFGSQRPGHFHEKFGASTGSGFAITTSGKPGLAVIVGWLLRLRLTDRLCRPTRHANRLPLQIENGHEAP